MTKFENGGYILNCPCCDTQKYISETGSHILYWNEDESINCFECNAKLPFSRDKVRGRGIFAVNDINSLCASWKATQKRVDGMIAELEQDGKNQEEIDAYMTSRTNFYPNDWSAVIGNQIAMQIKLAGKFDSSEITKGENDSMTLSFSKDGITQSMMLSLNLNREDRKDTAAYIVAENGEKTAIANETSGQGWLAFLANAN